jgi:RNA polymerase sigma-70 factor (ECF subfamily)
VTDGVAAVFRREYGRCVATLIRLLGDIDAAEEAVQEASAIAVAKWPVDGQPPNPGGWITTTARNRAIDRLHRESNRHARHREAHELYGPAATEQSTTDLAPVTDDRLRLIFTCCHPALSRQAQVALTLRLLGGLETPEIARAFLVPEATMAQRIVRAKRKIKEARIPYRAHPSRNCLIASPRCWPSSISSSTRGTPPRPANSSASSATRRSGSLACWPG